MSGFARLAGGAAFVILATGGAPFGFDVFEQARQMVRVAYPEFVADGAFASLHLPSSSQWTGRVPMTRMLLYPPRHQTGLPAPLSVTFEADEHGRLQSFLATGDYVGTSRLHVFAQQINAAATFDAEEVARRLAKAGAKFPRLPPGTADALNVGAFRAVLGDFRLSRTTFQLDNGAHDARDRQAVLLWRVRAVAAQGDVSETLDFTFEPFEGKLISMVRDGRGTRFMLEGGKDVRIR